MNFLAPLLALPAGVLAIVLHEVAHAWLITRCGDETPRQRGRFTLDPATHLDIFGLLFLMCGALIGAPLAAWGRPVPFDRDRLREPSRDVMLVHLAGPLSNLTQAAFWLLILWLTRLLLPLDSSSWSEIARLRPSQGAASLFGVLLVAGVYVNVGMAALNLLPLPPLDGYFVMRELGPNRWGAFWAQMGPGAYLVLFAALPALQYVLAPFVILARTGVNLAAGLPPGDGIF
jgi:Zn-dependent protease